MCCDNHGARFLSLFFTSQTTRFHFDDIFTFASFFLLFLFCVFASYDFLINLIQWKQACALFPLFYLIYTQPGFFSSFYHICSSSFTSEKSYFHFHFHNFKRYSYTIWNVHVWTYRHMLNWNRIKTRQDWNELYSH